MTLYDTSSVSIGPNNGNVLGDFQIISQNGSEGKLVMFSEEDANGVFTERNSLIFYGTSSYDNDEENTALARIQVSNDNPYPPDEQLVNGRIDLQVNNQNGSRITGLRSKIAINAEGHVGIHNINPESTFTVTPEYLDNDDVYTTTITGYTQSSNLVTFADDLFNVSYNPSLLRGGLLVVNDGSNLDSYILDNATTRTLNPTQSQLRLKTGYSLTDDTSDLVGKSFNIYYPGLFVNKYGMVGIGDANFDDTELSHQFTVSGNAVVKGDLHISSNIDSTSSNVFIRASNDGTQLQIKDDNTNGYINLMKKVRSTEITTLSTTTTLDWNTNGTVLVDETITINLPNTSSEYSGFKFTIKSIGSGKTVTISADGTEEIDGSTSDITITTQYESYTLQTDGNNWFVISKYTP